MKWFYEENLARVKSIIKGEEEDSPEWVNMGDLPGVQHHKLDRIDKNAQLWKFKVGVWPDGNIRWPENPPASMKYNLSEATAVWAEKGSGEVYALFAPGITGDNLHENLRRIGYEVEDSPKLFKRLKRVFSNATLASTENFSISVVETEDEDLDYAPLVDGMAFANLKFLRELLDDDRIRHGDVFQYGYIGEEGHSKGTLVAKRRLSSDFVVHSPNIKTEVRKQEGQILYIEGMYKAKVPSTDIQTLGNTGMISEFFRSFHLEIGELMQTAIDPVKRNHWFTEIFPSTDWWKDAVAKTPDGKRKPEKQRLTLACELGLRPDACGLLLRDTYRYLAKRVDIRRLKVRIHKEDGKNAGARGYMIPQIDQFDDDGFFAPNPKTVLRYNEIAFPKHILHEDTQCLVVRQPNGPGEFEICRHRSDKALKTGAVQMSPLAVMPELSEIYGLPGRPGGSVLEIHGGADMDDSLVCFTHKKAITAAMKADQEFEENLGKERPKLEEVIDRHVQDSKAPFTFMGQVKAAVQQPAITLAEIVNLTMGLTLLKKWDWLRLIARAETDEHLRWVADKYGDPNSRVKVKGEPLSQPAEFPACWWPKSTKSPEKGAKLPFKPRISTKEPLEYVDGIPRWTPVCKMMEKAGKSLLKVENIATNPMRNMESWLWKEKGQKLLDQVIMDAEDHEKVIKVAGALVDLWKKMTLRQEDGPAPDYAKAGKLWGVAVSKLFQGLEIGDRMAATCAIVKLVTKPKWRWTATGEKVYAPNFDSLVWNPARVVVKEGGKEKLVVNEGFIDTRQCWALFLLRLQEEMGSLENRTSAVVAG